MHAGHVLRAQRLAVGAATTAAVVNAIVYIIVADSLISVVYTLTGF